MLGQESQFVFLDGRPWPFLVKQHADGDWWLYYWADSQKTFVTLRKLDVSEVDRFRPLALSDARADLYLKHCL